MHAAIGLHVWTRPWQRQVNEEIYTHPFNGPLSGTTRVSRYQKGKTSLDFTEARDSEWQLHQLAHVQVCTLLQITTPAPHHSVFYRPDALPAAQPQSQSTEETHCTKTKCIKRWLGWTHGTMSQLGGGADPARRRDNFTGSFFELKCIRLWKQTCPHHGERTASEWTYPTKVTMGLALPRVVEVSLPFRNFREWLHSHSCVNGNLMPVPMGIPWDRWKFPRVAHL